MGRSQQGNGLSPRENFDSIRAIVCERRGWTCSADQVEVKLDGGRQQIVHLDYFEHQGVPLVRLHSIIGSTKKILRDRLGYALELNFGLPHGSFAIKGDLLVLVDTLLLAETDVAELDACIDYLADTGDYYERSMFGADNH